MELNSHLKFSKSIWKTVLDEKSIAIDATLGTGQDTLFLAKNCHEVHAFDIQEEAITRAKETIPDEYKEKIHFYQSSHEHLPPAIKPACVSLIVYNLGYLPGGDKTITTKKEGTIKSLHAAIPLLKPGGLLSLTAYPGHPEGAREELALHHFFTALDKKKWCVTHHIWLNRVKSPSLFLAHLIN